MIAFDKSARANWSLGWHRDRTICVAQRKEADGFGPWSVKKGLMHVCPPFALLARMVTLRVHLDAVDADNAPLRIALGSHLLGPISDNRMAGTVSACRQWSCLAKAGDIWAYATSILHASARAGDPRQRRVLQIDYSANALPHGLRWRGID